MLSFLVMGEIQKYSDAMMDRTEEEWDIEALLPDTEGYISLDQHVPGNSGAEQTIGAMVDNSLQYASGDIEITASRSYKQNEIHDLFESPLDIRHKIILGLRFGIFAVMPETVILSLDSPSPDTRRHNHDRYKYLIDQLAEKEDVTRAEIGTVIGLGVSQVSRLETIARARARTFMTKNRQ